MAKVWVHQQAIGMRDSYWHGRLERWGAWRVGAGVAGTAKVATWAGMRPSSSLGSWLSSEDALPRTFLEERETHEIITHLAHHRDTAELAAFAWAAYPNTTRLAAKLGLDKRALAERYKALHRRCARLLAQRKDGETLDAARRRPRGKPITTRAVVPGRRKPVAIASVVVD